MSVISVRQLGKQYRLGVKMHNTLRDQISSWFSAGKAEEAQTFWAVQDVSFDVQAGETVGIIGRNGAGKSTLLKILSQITEPTTGEVRIRGRVASLLEVGTGFHPELSGRENVFLNGAILGMSRREIRAKFDEIVAFAEVEKFIDTPVKHYSSGMYVRLAFAVAAHLDPEILIVDEVLAVGDAAFQRKCLGKMGEVSKSGRTILFVSHNMAAIQQLCDRGILLERGQVVMDRSSEEVATAYLGTAQQGVVSHYQAPESVASGKVVLREAEVFGSDDRGVAQLRFGEPFAIRMVWENQEDVPSASVSVRCYDAVEQLLFGVNTLQCELPIGQRGRHELVCRFDGNVLVPGQYFLAIGCYVRPHTTHHEVNPCLSFSVSDVAWDSRRTFNIVGHPKFSLPARWTIS